MNKNEAITKIKRQETRENREEQKGALIYGDQDQYIYIQRKGWPDPKGNSVKFNKQSQQTKYICTLCIHFHVGSLYALTRYIVTLILSGCPLPLGSL